MASRSAKHNPGCACPACLRERTERIVKKLPKSRMERRNERLKERLDLRATSTFDRDDGLDWLYGRPDFSIKPTPDDVLEELYRRFCAALMPVDRQTLSAEEERVIRKSFDVWLGRTARGDRFVLGDMSLVDEYLEYIEGQMRERANVAMAIVRQLEKPTLTAKGGRRYSED